MRLNKFVEWLYAVFIALCVMDFIKIIGEWSICLYPLLTQ